MITRMVETFTAVSLVTEEIIKYIAVRIYGGKYRNKLAGRGIAIIREYEPILAEVSRHIVEEINNHIARVRETANTNDRKLATEETKAKGNHEI